MVMGSSLQTMTMLSMPALMTLQGTQLGIHQNTSGGLMVGQANLIEADLVASNGTIHIIDTVLMLSTTASSSM